jgi:hypothetical protein
MTYEYEQVARNAVKQFDNFILTPGFVYKFIVRGLLREDWFEFHQ